MYLTPSDRVIGSNEKNLRSKLFEHRPTQHMETTRIQSHPMDWDLTIWTCVLTDYTGAGGCRFANGRLV